MKTIHHKRLPNEVGRVEALAIFSKMTSLQQVELWVIAKKPYGNFDLFAASSNAIQNAINLRNIIL